MIRQLILVILLLFILAPNSALATEWDTFQLIENSYRDLRSQINDGVYSGSNVYAANYRVFPASNTPSTKRAMPWIPLLLLSEPQQKVFNVTKTSDTADGKCDADCSLREAIIAANASPGEDIVILPTGTYTLNIAGTDEDGSATGDLDITDHLTIKGESAANTIIDGAEIDRVIDIDPVGSGLIVEISDVKVKNGNAPNVSDIACLSGGGIDNRGTLTLTNVTITANTAIHVGGNGGGLHNLGSMSLSNVIISSNTGYFAGGIANEGTLTVVDSEVSGNISSGAIGSAGGFFNNGTATLINTRVNNNSANVGGGIRNSQLLKLLNCTISDNTASLSMGGGIYNEGFLTLTNSTVSSNITNIDGGGIYNKNLAALASVTIVNNHSSNGQGGGIYNKGAIQIENSLLANNTASSTANNCTVTTEGSITDFGYNLEDTNSCGFTKTGDIINTDPLLGPLMDNGGHTQTHALSASSPAIDTGNPNGCKDVDGVTDLITDQRGFSRHVDGNGDNIPTCDIGAFEYAP